MKLTEELKQYKRVQASIYVKAIEDNLEEIKELERKIGQLFSSLNFNFILSIVHNSGLTLKEKLNILLKEE